jgi:uncharacterized protein YjiS (DUF1127 family)
MDSHILTTLEVFETVTQLLEVSDFMLSSCLGFDRFDVDGMSIRWADDGLHRFNCIAVTDPVDHSKRLRDLFRTAANYMRRRQNIGSLWLFDTFLSPQLRDIADDVASLFGLVRTSSALGFANTVISPAASLPDLTLKTIDADNAANLYLDLLARVGGVHSSAMRAKIGCFSLPKNSLSLLSLRGETPVSASTVAAINGRLSILFTATLPTEQGKGFGEATLREALCFEADRTGILRTLAQASKALQPFYEGMGYHPTANARRYIHSEIAST